MKRDAREQHDADGVIEDGLARKHGVEALRGADVRKDGQGGDGVDGRHERRKPKGLGNGQPQRQPAVARVVDGESRHKRGYNSAKHCKQKDSADIPKKLFLLEIFQNEMCLVQANLVQRIPALKNNNRKKNSEKETC